MGHPNVENETARNVNFFVLKIAKGRRKCPRCVTRGSDQARKCSKNPRIVVYDEHRKFLTGHRGHDVWHATRIVISQNFSPPHNRPRRLNASIVPAKTMRDLIFRNAAPLGGTKLVLARRRLPPDLGGLVERDRCVRHTQWSLSVWPEVGPARLRPPSRGPYRLALKKRGEGR